MTENEQPSKVLSEEHYRTIQTLYDSDGNEQNFVLVQNIKVVHFEDGSALVDKGTTSLYELAKTVKAADEPRPAPANAPAHRTGTEQLAEDIFVAYCLCGWKGAEHSYRGRASREADEHLLDIATAPE